MSTFELLLYVTMGDLVQQAITQQDYSVTGSLLAVSSFALLVVAISWFQWRFPSSRPLITGRPVLVFADVIDNFVIVRYLSGGAATEPVSVKIYNTARAAPTPALNAVASLVLLASLLAVTLGYLAYRRLTRGESTGAAGIDAFTGEG